MNRRLFGLFVLVAVSVGCSRDPGEPQPQQSAVDFELNERSVAELQEAMASGRYTSRRLVDMYLERIAAIDSAGPRLRSIIEVNPDATSIADALDGERKNKGPRGPLHGIPVLIKDNIDTGDKMLTSAGSLALTGGPAPRDAFLVERLRAAGAVILGKTNLSEWANIRSIRSTSGWSARGGLVKNPYVLDRNPCGSSSGSGAAIAANLAAVAVGTETDGSILCPSAINALVGMKPTVGLISRSGIIPISHSQDTAGPMARTVADAAVLLEAMAASDARDPATSPAATADTSYLKALNPDALRGARLGIARSRFFGYSAATDRAIEAAVAQMKSLGATIVDPADIPNADKLEACEIEVLLHEFKADLNAYLATRPDAAAHSLKELIAFNERERAREMPHFGQELFVMAEAKGALTTPAYQQALSTCRRLARDEGIDAVMTQHRLDALVSPTVGPAWPTDLLNGDHFTGGTFPQPAAVAGYPSITVPAGWVGELPVGISFIGRAWNEAKLIGLAFAFEQASRHRKPPRFLATVPLE